MFRGERINITEKRAVLHVALRGPRDATLMLDGTNVVAGVHAVLDKMASIQARHYSLFRPKPSPPLRQ
jgi:glucose-6-phosphate isomerase